MRKYLYIILVSVSAVFLGMILIFSKKPVKTIPSFKERTGTIALSGEWLNTKQAIEALLKDIELNPENFKAKLQLSQAYIQEARITGDHGYYDAAALELLDDVIKNEPGNFDALCCKATVLLSQHHFTEGLLVAQQAIPLNPNSAFIYGLMCDAYVETGNYKEAVKVCDKMISIRPDMRSYARVSYLREIHGDLDGSIQAAKLAVSAGYPGLEQSEWTRMILAHLFEQKGQLDSAEIQYKMALAERPDYPFAIAGLSNIAKQKGNYKVAIAGYEKAKKMIIEYSFADELTDLYQLNNEMEKAKVSAEEVIALLSPIADVDEGESGHGHYADKELAYAYLKVPNTEKALKHALLEYERRPDNIDVCETLAWVYYKKGDYVEANRLVDKAMRTHSQSPTLLCHAGLIKIKTGQKTIGDDLIRQALKTNPYLDIELKREIKGNIASL
ncbi:MAG: transposase [Bacteroidota bacterium]